MASNGTPATRRQPQRKRTKKSSTDTKRTRRPQAQSAVRGPAARPAQAAGKAQGRGRNRALDGFRALAIAAVVCYHLGMPWLPSGHVGVVMLLVLTGYLVTSSLLRRARSGVRALPGFWGRRFARVWPPMALMVGLVVLACILFNRILLTKARPDVLPSLGLFQNISYIMRGVSYFDEIGGTSPLLHLWYLGIDAQFCLVWPIIMMLCMRILPSRATTRRLALILAAASAVAMGVLYQPGAGITRIYYGPDTRAFAPLVGAWLAFALPVGRRPARDVRPFVERFRLHIELASLASVVALVAAMALIPNTSPVLYRGGMFVASLLSAIIIAALVLPGGILTSTLSLPPLVWLGSRSYGIYLWHYPLIRLLSPAVGAAPWWVAPVAVGLSCVLAELSYRFIEQPLAQPGLLGRAAGRIAQGPAGILRSRMGVCAVVALMVTVADGVGLAVIPDETLVPADAIVSTGESADHAMDLSKKQEETEPQSGDEAAEALNERAADLILHAPASEKDVGIYDPVLIGDSVPGDAEAYWNAACPDGLLDSYVGRSPEQAMQVLDEYLAQDVVGKVVILQAFSNQPCTDEQLDHMIQACGSDREVYLVTIRVPDLFQDEVNERLVACAERYDNVHIIDWHALSEGTIDWIYPDGEHLTPTGQPIYINMIVDAIDEVFADAGGTITRRDTDTPDDEDASDETQQAKSDESETLDGVELVEDAAPLRILMLGNSLTYYNNMPSMLAELTGAEIVTHTRGGAHLKEHLDPDSKMGVSTQQALAEGHWDYVVLQEQSAEPIDTESGEYLDSVTRLSELAREAGATPIIYATWPYQEGADRYNKLNVSREEMGKLLHDAFVNAASSTGALMADVETAFSQASAEDMLYSSDGVHPSSIGSRLAAEVIAKTIEEDQKKN